MTESFGQKFTGKRLPVKIMPKMLRELALIVAGVAIGFGLLYISSLVEFTKPQDAATIWWCFPYFWRVSAGGFQSACSGEGIFVFGVCLFRTFYTSFAEDLVFWVALSLTAVEVSSHTAIPYVRRKLKIRHAKQSTVPAASTDLIQSPDASA